MVELWRWGLLWVVKGWVYWYESGFVVMGVGLGLSWVWVWVCRHGLWGLWVAFFFLGVDIVDYELLVMVVSGVCSAVVVGLW